jgi:hypothetical protein
VKSTGGPLCPLAILLLAACNFDGTAATDPASGYDALVGTWIATTFVVSDQTDPKHDAQDLTHRPAGRGPARRVTLRLDANGSGRLEILEIGDHGTRSLLRDEFTVVSSDQHTMSLSVGLPRLERPVAVEHFRSLEGDQLTLRFTYPLDLDGDGQRQDHLIVATFRRAA